MIINDTVSTPLVSTFGSTPSRFKIKASAKAFKILSGFYSEPILAIPRELGANAWDSHVKAGNTKTPFEVHAPNTLEPWFSIRDFGTGLSSEDIDQIYTTYFESTKTNDNDSDGCMGLGSKTPFNYADNFTVTSWFGGKKHVYNCFIDETGSPNIMHIVTEDSKDHSGVEVKFAVKASDIGMWVDKITRAYAPFRNRPVIKGANITFQPREYLYQKDGWAYRKADGWNSQRGTNAFMGNYCYPVALNAIRSALGKEDDYYLLERALNYGHFDLFFNIGDLEVAPNKEQLQYEDDNATTKNIIAAIKTAVNDFKRMVMDKLEVPKTRWEAMNLHAKYNGYSSEYSHIRSLIGDIPIKFNNEQISANSISVTTVHNELKLKKAKDGSGLEYPFQLHALDTLYGKIKRTSNYHTNGPSGKKTIFFYTNGETIKNARLRYYLSTKYGTGSVPMCYIITDPSPKAENFHAHAKYFGWEKADVIDIESLPKPPPAARTKTTSSTDEIFVFEADTLFNPSDDSNTPRLYWKKRGETVDSTKTYYYIDFLWYDPAIKGAQVSNTLMGDVFAVAKKNKLLPIGTTIYGINAKNRKLMKVGKWINVVDLVTKHINKHRADFENEYYLQNFGDKLRELHDIVRAINYGSLVNKIENPQTKALFSNLISTYKKYVDSNVHKPDELFYSQFGIAAKSHGTAPVDIPAIKKLVEQKYMGLFGLVDTYRFDATTFVRLINFIDKNS